MTPGSMDVLEGPHTMDVILYVRRKGRCTKSEVYRDVWRSQGVARRIDALADSGILTKGAGDRHACSLSLTEEGERIAEHLAAIERLMDGDS